MEGALHPPWSGGPTADFTCYTRLRSETDPRSARPLKKVEKKLSKLLITPGLPNSLYIYIEVLQLKLPI